MREKIKGVVVLVAVDLPLGGRSAGGSETLQNCVVDLTGFIFKVRVREKIKGVVVLVVVA